MTQTSQLDEAQVFFFTLKLYTPEFSELTSDAWTLTLTQLGDQIQRCRLSFSVPFDLYQEQISTKAWFHLTPEVRKPNILGEFSPHSPIELDLELDPALLPLIARIPGGAWSAVAVLAQNATDPNVSFEEVRSLLQTESWYAIHVKQEMDAHTKGGFATTWATSLYK